MTHLQAGVQVIAICVIASIMLITFIKTWK